MYEVPFTRSKPGCIVFLLDRSDSMGRDWGNSETFAEGAARAVNAILFELCLRALKTQGVTAHYFDVGVFGYGVRPHAGGYGVESALGGRLQGRALVPLPDLANNPLDLGEDRSPSLGDPPVKVPHWVEPVHGGLRPMCEAIAVAGRHVFDWVQLHPGSFPPIIFNITNGWVTDSPYDGASIDEWATRLTALRTLDGRALLLNIFLSTDHGTPTIFPGTSAGLPDPGPSLFQISSMLPRKMVDTARNDDLVVGNQSRGLVFNADATTLLEILEIGTRIDTRPAREPVPRMGIQQVIFSAPKEGYQPADWEDGAGGGFDPGASAARFAVADGASASYDSRRWASQLVDSFLSTGHVARPAGPELDRDSLGEWLARMQHDWALGVPSTTNQIEKVKIRQGAFATFVGCQLDGLDGKSSPRWRAVAIGDATLFHVRDSRLLTHLPSWSPADFGTAPDGLSTRPERQAESLDRFQFGSGALAPGDLLFAATNVFAQWILTWVEKDERTLWRALAALAHPADFDQLVAKQRQARTMRDDDVTLLRVRLLSQAPDRLVVWQGASVH